jgi:hypothetical protein
MVVDGGWLVVMLALAGMPMLVCALTLVCVGVLELAVARFACG